MSNLAPRPAHVELCERTPREVGSQTMAWAEDDMAIVAEMAAEAGIALPQAGVNREICRALKPRRHKLEMYGPDLLRAPPG